MRTARWGDKLVDLDRIDWTRRRCPALRRTEVKLMHVMYAEALNPLLRAKWVIPNETQRSLQ